MSAGRVCSVRIICLVFYNSNNCDCTENAFIITFSKMCHKNFENRLTNTKVMSKMFLNSEFSLEK